MAKATTPPKPPRRPAPRGSHVSNRTGEVVANRGRQGKPAVRPGPTIGPDPGGDKGFEPWQPPQPGFPVPEPGPTVGGWGAPPPGGWYTPPGSSNPVIGLVPPPSGPTSPGPRDGFEPWLDGPGPHPNPNVPVPGEPYQPNGTRPPITSGYYGDLTTQGPRKPVTPATTTTAATTASQGPKPGKRGNVRSEGWLEKHPNSPAAARAARPPRTTPAGAATPPFTPTGDYGSQNFLDFFQNDLWEGGDLQSIPENFMADNPGFVEGLFSENFWPWMAEGGAVGSDPTSQVPLTPAQKKAYRKLWKQYGLGAPPEGGLDAYQMGQLGTYIPGVTGKNPEKYYSNLAQQATGGFAQNNIWNTPEFISWALQHPEGLQAAQGINPSVKNQLFNDRYGLPLGQQYGIGDFATWMANQGRGSEIAQYLLDTAGNPYPGSQAWLQGAPGYSDFHLEDLRATALREFQNAQQSRPWDSTYSPAQQVQYGPDIVGQEWWDENIGMPWTGYKGKVHGTSPGDPTKADIYPGYKEGTLAANKVGKSPTPGSEGAAPPATTPTTSKFGDIPQNLTQPSMAPRQGYIPDYYYGGAPEQYVPPPLPAPANTGEYLPYQDAGTNPQNKFEDFMAMMQQWEQPTETAPASFPVSKRSRARRPRARGRNGRNDRGRR